MEMKVFRVQIIWNNNMNKAQNMKSSIKRLVIINHHSHSLRKQINIQ